jgi:hypothetical protein
MPANETHLVLLEDTHSWISQSSIQGRLSVRFRIRSISLIASPLRKEGVAYRILI